MVSGADAVQSLWALLTDWDPDAPEDAALMEPVALTVCFRQSRVPVVSVGMKSRSVCSDEWIRPTAARNAAVGLVEKQGIELTEM